MVTLPRAVREIENELRELPDDHVLLILASLKQDDLLEEFLGWLKFADHLPTKEAAAETRMLLEERKRGASS